MSAFLCSSYHVGRLAAYIAAKGGEYVRYHAEVSTTGRGADLATEIAQLMARENVASIHGRYPDTVENFTDAPGTVRETHDGDDTYVMWCGEAARVEWRGEHSAPDMIQAADCYSYQSCEHDGWKASQGHALFRFAKDLAVKELMKGQDANGWELSSA